MQELFRVFSPYKLLKLKTLPQRNQPAYRVTSNMATCSLAELLASVVGGAQQIEVAEDIWPALVATPNAYIRPMWPSGQPFRASASKRPYESRQPWHLALG